MAASFKKSQEIKYSTLLQTFALFPHWENKNKISLAMTVKRNVIKTLVFKRFLTLPYFSIKHGKLN
jgi:hypothetical protein